MNENKALPKVSGGLKNSVSFKIFTIFILILILLIPASMIQSLIYEREARKGEVIHEISSKWGNEQKITGPILTIPYKKFYKDKNSKISYTIRYMHFLPDALNFNCKIFPEIRYRGIYEAVLYNTKVEISGNFQYPVIGNFNIPKEDVVWSGAYLSMGISDMRGIKDQVNVTFDQKELLMNPGMETTEVIAAGVSSKISLNEEKKIHPFKMSINLNGSYRLSFVPVGKTTTASMTSTWMDPSFDGVYLPLTRDIGKDGFTAKWKILHLNRAYPQQWSGNKYKLDGSDFGVKLFIPVDIYQKSTRTAKYALMFIVFAFIAFFFSEIMNKVRLHPIQYLLVGFSITIFYVLLISISEHVNFDMAYLISGISVIMLISGYAKSVLKNIRMTAMVSGILIILYTYLYILLQLEDYALLMGGMGLFVVLSVVMYMTRKLDWYAIKFESNSDKEIVTSK
ncbi:MAG: cell envelope integrity protein CreD [Deltaproteobacteria bacterium]|nr:cell envelope integrity protein CreD [Deltaproteobacteria bacterium]